VQLGDAVQSGDLLAPFTWESESDFSYPPLVRSVGALTELVGLAVHEWATIALNLLFVPILAAGCYLTGRLVFGPMAGLLAVVFALATPMTAQMFHVQMLDGPLAATVAIAFWALLACDGFRDRRRSILAGALIGLALLVKSPAALFLAGPFAVMLARGGWRQWRSLAWLAGAALVVAAPYYAVHLGDYLTLTGEAAGASSDPWTREHGAIYDGAERFTLENLGWYFWAAVNNQYLLPFFALLVVGVIFCLRRIRTPYVAELLAGLVGGYLAMTALAVHDSRYTLPLVVFAAVIATGWIAAGARAWASAAGLGVLFVAAAINFAGSTMGVIGTTRLTLFEHGAGGLVTDLTVPGALTIADQRGYVVGERRPDPFWESLFAAAESDGVNSAHLDVKQAVTWGVEQVGFNMMSRAWGIQGPFTVEAPSRRTDIIVETWWAVDRRFAAAEGLGRPCGIVEDGIASPVLTGLPQDEGTPLAVLVKRRGADGELRRWCEFDAASAP
jgi:hypothetical protein